MEPNDEDWTSIKYQVFDIPDPDLVNKPFSERIEIYQQVVEECCQKWNAVMRPPGITKPKECPIEFTEQIKVTDISQAYEIYKSFIERNAEGAMLRPPNSIYEHKRSKLLLKWKPSLDAEAIVIGYNEGSGRLKGRLGNNVSSYPDTPTLTTLVPTSLITCFIALWKSRPKRPNDIEIILATRKFPFLLEEVRIQSIKSKDNDNITINI